eukprot:TRINITY_DN11750_c0_g3_i1.p1 TRINITY_DN11750_c0_g3~~TRINITY_DN11750_c0_g3_i1.p1  ORF type:complete len:416 (-),score=88.43 TRINITY_DN11750_c0_g3_i1:313-1560(-)
MHTMEPPIAHRDIKIENILLQKKKFKLCDFGSASTENVDFKEIPKNQYALYEEEFEKNTTLMYRPPEMCDPFLNYHVNTKVDVWMLGCVLYTLCFFKHPFQECSKLAIVSAGYHLPKEIKFSQKLIDLIILLLTPNPDFRPSIHDVINILDQWDSLDSIPLNEQAQEIKDRFKKEQTDTFGPSTFSKVRATEDIPEEELKKLSAMLKKEEDQDEEYLEAQRKKIFDKTKVESKTAPSPAPVPVSTDFISFDDFVTVGAKTGGVIGNNENSDDAGRERKFSVDWGDFQTGDNTANTNNNNASSPEKKTTSPPKKQDDSQIDFDEFFIAPSKAEEKKPSSTTSSANAQSKVTNEKVNASWGEFNWSETPAFNDQNATKTNPAPSNNIWSLPEIKPYVEENKAAQAIDEKEKKTSTGH